MRVTTSAWRARAALAVGAAALSLLAVGCTDAGEREHPRPGVFDVFDQPQSQFDLLPAGSPALLTVVPNTTRSVGGTGMYEFFFARGIAAPYCVVAVDVYDRQVGQACGGGMFGGSLAEGVQFEFGEFWAKGIAGGRGTWQLNEHLTIAMEEPEVVYPAVEHILARPQLGFDVPPITDDGGGWADPADYRLLALVDGVSFYMAKTQWAGPMVCIFTHAADADGNAWGSGACGSRDIVLHLP
ncbi:MAG TPA: hypothetical protein PK890_08340, partial [Terrimesophilobacter sp.]|nr:hypothetical protein [Terrimesophilobacter sp.]